MTAPDSERGGIAVIVALLMVALLGFAAISIDVARLYSERAQLQNGADSVALMLAQKCAKNEPECSAPASLASTLANANAVDGQSNVKSIDLKTDSGSGSGSGSATVTTGAKETGGTPNSVSNFFARALGIPTSEVTATSSVQWGTPSRGTVSVPLAIAECKFSVDPALVQTLYLDAGGCAGVPGGFGWITDTADTKCSVKVSAGASSDAGIWFSSDTGASAPSVCTSADISAIRNQTILLPLYAVATGTGSSGKYYVKGFAAFRVTGYHFSSEEWPTSDKLPNKTIRGSFVKFVSLSQALELGSTPDYGTAVVRLTIGAP